MLHSHQVMLLLALFPMSAVPHGAVGNAAPRTAPPVVTLTLSDDKIAGPATISSGFTTFHAVNVGTELHHATLLRLAPGKTMADLLAALKNPGPPPAWVTWLGGPQSAGTAIIKMTPGNYVWICLIPGADGVPHFVKGMVAPMAVTAAANGAVAPTADIVVTMTDYNWSFSKDLTAGPHTLKVVTAAGQPHEFVVIRLTPGKHAKDVTDWVAKMVGPPPAESVEGLSTQQPMQESYTTIIFKPGTYAFFCFVPDAKDGKEHAMHGMVKELTVQ